MQQILSRAITIVFLIITILGCNDKVSNTNPVKKYYITKTIDEEATFEYSYDEDMNLVSISDPESDYLKVFDVVDGKTIKITEHDGESVTEVDLYYNNDGFCDRMTFDGRTIELSRNSIGEITSVLVYSDDNLTMGASLIWENGNMIQSRPIELASHRYFYMNDNLTYDNRRNIYSNIPNIFGYYPWSFMPSFIWQNLDNNIIERYDLDSDETTKYIYEYNDAGYPITRTEYTDGEDPWVTHYEYIYK